MTQKYAGGLIKPSLFWDGADNYKSGKIKSPCWVNTAGRLIYFTERLSP
jgi:hypothetical protein